MNTDHVAPRTGPPHALVFIFVTVLLDVTAMGMVLPILPKLLSELSGQTVNDAARYAGWLLFAFAAAQFFSAPVMGGLSDRFGRRPVLLAASFGFALDYVLLACAPTIGWLFVGRVVAGITGATTSTATAYVADVSEEGERAQNFGLVTAALGIGFVFGPILGGVLGHFGPRVPFVAAAGLTLANCLYGYFVLPESLPPERRRAFEWKRTNPVSAFLRFARYPAVLGLAGALFLSGLASQATQSTWTFYTIYKFGWSTSQVGYSLGLVGLLLCIVQGWLGRYIHPRLGQRGAIAVGLLLFAVANIGFAFAPAGWVICLALVPFSIGGIADVALQAAVSRRVPADEQGELQGALTGVLGLNAMFGPPLMTGIFAHFTSPAAPIRFAGAAFILAVAFLALAELVSFRALAGDDERR